MNYKRERKAGIIQSVIFWGIFIYLIIVLISQQKILDNTQGQHEEIKQKLSLEQTQNENLKNELEIVNTDEFYEKIAREVFGYVKKGEKVYVVGN